jgi:hypothetical protein
LALRGGVCQAITEPSNSGFPGRELSGRVTGKTIQEPRGPCVGFEGRDSLELTMDGHQFLQPIQLGEGVVPSLSGILEFLPKESHLSDHCSQTPVVLDRDPAALP